MNKAANDLISRTALLKDLSYCAPELWQDEEYIKAKIMKQRPVDAVPVVRGLWIYFNGAGKAFYQCSACFHWIDAKTDRNYCPNC